MILAQRNVLGGPDRDVGAVVRLRRALQAECAPLDVPGLDELDVVLALGGSVTPSAGPAGVRNVRFSRSRRRITATVVVPAHELDATTPELDALLPHLAELAATVAARCAPDAPDAVRSALAGAFERAVATATRA
ncbi:hypothetical protein EQW78_14000 [Oerskovia turbata]|uniref:Uncharacterized protein n=1 Tax=Oerskovia turbata TaxID=1713 RepID=A0A4Q1KR85_9CELL|nr:hypothetical protein [Oerskovia turbata]RXR22357.1 hypothetical protein EQW73_16565 [Oerskovia turbata]RXR32422.1 hypothetical protein EQW78_14000 [Oerskovia turbata]